MRVNRYSRGGPFDFLILAAWMFAAWTWAIHPAIRYIAQHIITITVR